MKGDSLNHSSVDEDEEDGSLLIEETPRFNEIKEAIEPSLPPQSINEFQQSEEELQQHICKESDNQQVDGKFNDETNKEPQQEIMEDSKELNGSSIQQGEIEEGCINSSPKCRKSNSSTIVENNSFSGEHQTEEQNHNNDNHAMTSPKEGTNSNEEVNTSSNISVMVPKRNLSIVSPLNPYASMDRMSVTPSTQNTPKNSRPSSVRSITPGIRKKSPLAPNGLSANYQGSKHNTNADIDEAYNSTAAKLPNINKKNHYEFDNLKSTSSNERKEKSPRIGVENSITSILNKKGLGIKRTGAISGKIKPTWHSCEKLPKPGVSSIPHHGKTLDIYEREELYRGAISPNKTIHSADIRASPNSRSKSQKSTFREKLLKENYQSVKDDSDLSRILFGEISEGEFEDFGIEKHTLNTSSFATSSKKISPMLKTWNGFSTKDSYVQSLMSTTKEDNELKSLKYNLGSMVSYENKKFKPPLLEAMENFIGKELRLVTREMKKENGIMNDVEYIVTRSCIYKECFKIFIDHSRTYGPILSNILEELSNAVDELKLRITIHADKSTQHHSNKEEDALRMHKVYRDTSKEIEMVKQHNFNLEREVLAMREKEAGLLETIEKLGVDIRKYEKRRNDDIKRSMILNDAIQYRDAKENEIKKQLSGLQVVAHEKTKIEQLYVESLQELDKLNNMVPKADYQNLLSRNDQLEQLLKGTKTTLTQEQRINKLLSEKLNELKLNNTVLEERLLDQSRSLTPRPKWDLVRDDLSIESLQLDSNTIENVNQLARRISKLQILVKKQQKELQENAKALDFLKSDDVVREKVFNNYFMGLGTGPSVPKYLRHRGKIRNKRFKKKDIMGIVNDMWKARMKQRDGPERFKDSISDFFESFITMKVGNIGSIKSELIYNIVFGAEHYIWDTDCYLFTKIMKREVSELVFFEMFNMIQQLRKMFVKLDEAESGIANGTVQKRNANRQLEIFFEGKPPDDILKIKVDMHRDQKDAVIKYENLFLHDNDGFDGRFLTTIKRQFIREIEEYNIEVEEYLREKEDREKTLTLRRVKEIFEYKQVCIDNIEEVLRFGVGKEIHEELDYEQFINIEEFMRNIKENILLKRTSIKDVAEMQFEFELEKQLESVDEGSDGEKAFLNSRGSEGKISFIKSIQSPKSSNIKPSDM